MSEALAAVGLVLAFALIVALHLRAGRCGECGGRDGWHDDNCQRWWRG